jgi:tRNA pseudouridine32 synthase/23S rRNA pseudouridine746 synthase
MPIAYCNFSPTLSRYLCLPIAPAVSERSANIPSHFFRFQSPVEGIALPEKFNYPFHYVPHEIALAAATELQTYLRTQSDWEHDFGMEPGNDGEIIGKMFGVLVVKNQQSELGYLCAVSGRLAGNNLHEKFVPPVFDILVQDGFFRKGETIISEINSRIYALEKNPDFLAAQKALAQGRTQSVQELEESKQKNKTQKEARDLKRKELEAQYTEDELHSQLKALNQQSINEHYHLKQLKLGWNDKLATLEDHVASFEQEIDTLKEERKTRSATLQDAIFDQFYFVNKDLTQRSVGDIFKYTPEGRPTAGAGECAAPKLLQYAFLNQLEPFALAEFWWGQSPKSEIRIHGHYYPACRGKCEPILGHMLQGMNIDENPMLKNPAEGKDLPVVWEDEHIVIINKPHEFLSVPGKSVDDSVLTRLKERYPEAPELMVVHRLDMSTSGLLVAAKTMEIYKNLQSQFEQREVKKRYVALLEGNITDNAGWIDLPLRVDLNDRPRQLVCHEHGKPAQTRWKVIERKDGRTKVYFFPVTGRTHQLRVHAAHPLGLNTPMVGDDLYGQRSTRLHLHAERIEFMHPVSGKRIAVEVPAEF